MEAEYFCDMYAQLEERYIGDRSFICLAWGFIWLLICLMDGGGMGCVIFLFLC